MKYSFETQWPAPFARGWQQSKLKFDSAEEAGRYLTEWLVISLDNGICMEGRIVELPLETE